MPIDDDTPTPPLHKCLCCGYSLAGLPAAHTCPECGLDYDPHSHAIEISPPQSTFSMVSGFLSWVAMAAVIANTMRDSIVFALMVAALIGLVAHSLLSVRHGRRVIVNASGLHLVTRRRIERSIAWETIRQIEISWVHGGLCVRLQDGRTVALSGDPKTARVCRSHIERAREDYAKKWADIAGRHAESAL